MGDRAVITSQDKTLGIYLHWHGGRDYVTAFLKYCELRGFRNPSEDNYGWARLCQIISNYIGGDLSIGIDTFDSFDGWQLDNGVYIIDGWEITGRECFTGEEQNYYSILDLLIRINEAQPEKDRIDLDKLVLNH